MRFLESLNDWRKEIKSRRRNGDDVVERKGRIKGIGRKVGMKEVRKRWEA